MNRTLRSTLCATTLAVLALTGCSSETGGDPTPGDSNVEGPAETSEETDGSTSPADGGRAIEDLDVGAAAEDSCLLLTADQLSALQLVEPGELVESAGVGQCTWSNRESTTVNRLLAGRDDVAGGIAELTENADSFPFFEGDIEVAGRPAVHYDTMAEPVGQCSVQVDLTVDSALLVTTYLAEEDPAYSDPCAKADEIASLAIENIQGGI